MSQYPLRCIRCSWITNPSTTWCENVPREQKFTSRLSSTMSARSIDTTHIQLHYFSGTDTNDKEAHLHAIRSSLIIEHDISTTTRSDDLNYSINYCAGVYATCMMETLFKARYTTLQVVVDHVLKTLQYTREERPSRRLDHTIETTHRRIYSGFLLEIITVGWGSRRGQSIW